MNWQPIESAPKDGTWILAVRAGCHPQYGGRFIPATVMWVFDRWTENDGTVDPIDHSSAWEGLTHWMPLPEPPEIGAKP